MAREKVIYCPLRGEMIELFDYLNDRYPFAVSEWQKSDHGYAGLNAGEFYALCPFEQLSKSFLPLFEEKMTRAELAKLELFTSTLNGAGSDEAYYMIISYGMELMDLKASKGFRDCYPDWIYPPQTISL